MHNTDRNKHQLPCLAIVVEEVKVWRGGAVGHYTKHRVEGMIEVTEVFLIPPPPGPETPNKKFAYNCTVRAQARLRGVKIYILNP